METVNRTAVACFNSELVCEDNIEKESSWMYMQTDVEVQSSSIAHAGCTMSMTICDSV